MCVPDANAPHRAALSFALQIAPYYGQGFDRVWLAESVNIRPGIAVTRSFGDLTAESVGVCPEPEIKSISLLDLKAEIVVVMSDGVYEHAPNMEVRAAAAAAAAAATATCVLDELCFYR